MSMYLHQSEWDTITGTVVIPRVVCLTAFPLASCMRIRTLTAKLSFLYAVAVNDDTLYELYISAQKALTDYTEIVIEPPTEEISAQFEDASDSLFDTLHAFSQDQWLCFLLDTEAFLDINVDEDEPPLRIDSDTGTEPFFKYLHHVPPRTFRNITLRLDSKWDTTVYVGTDIVTDKLTPKQYAAFLREATIVGVSSYLPLGGNTLFPKWLARRLGWHVQALPSVSVLPTECDLENQDVIFVSVKLSKKLETALL